MGGSLETVNAPDYGWLVDPTNAHDIAQSINEIIAMDNERKDKIHNANISRCRELYTKEKMCHDTVELYKKLLKNKQG